MRRTNDRRIIIGGNDAPFRWGWVRDALLPLQYHNLRTSLRELLGNEALQLERAWCGTFAESRDSLPILSADPSRPQVYHVLACGGNGTTFAVLAAEIIRSWIHGRVHDAAPLFSMARFTT